MSITAALRIALMLTGVIALGDEPTLAAQDGKDDSELTLVPGRGALLGGYGLGVTTAVPAPPGLDDGDARAAGGGCPFEVRAIVEAEVHSENFAVVALGTESKLVHAGNGFQKSGVRMTIVAIEPHVLVVRVGDELVRCNFK